MNKRVLHSVFLRSFFLQGTWNFERMQNLGFCYSILPVLREVYNEGDELKEAVRGHLEFFNTHPYMASLILGAVARMEEEVREGRLDRDAVGVFKTGVMGSCGAIGDSFFWGSVKPLASLIGVCLAAAGQMIAPVVFMTVYNIPHLWMRVLGIYGGYEEGPDIFDRIRRFNFTEAMKKLKILTALLAGALLAVLAHLEPGGLFSDESLLNGAGAAILFLGLYWAFKRGMSTQLLIYISLLLTVGVSAVV